MKTKIRNIILLAVALGIIVMIFVFSFLSTRTKFNDSAIIGNTAGNLYNGGLYCEYGDYIYFSNFNDDGTLYRMNASSCTNIKKLYDDKICYINADENYLYYSRINNQKKTGTASIFTFYNTGIYRLPRDRSGKIQLLYNNPSGMLLLLGNYIYYQHYSDEEGLNFHRVKIDASEDLMISTEALLPASAYQNNIYYSGVASDHSLHLLNTDTLDFSSVYDGSTYFPIAVTDGIYFIALTDYSIRKYNFSDGGITTLVSDPCCTYNISPDERYLYYQVDRSENNRICVLDLQTMSSTVILNGDFKQIHVTSSYVFFVDFSETLHYAYATDGSGVLSSFHPSTEQ